MTSAVRDALSVSITLAARVQSELRAWEEREGHIASRAALQLAKLANSVSIAMADRVRALTADAANRTLEDLAALNKRARVVEDLRAVLDGSSHKTLHPVLRPTIERELTELGVRMTVLVYGSKATLYEIEDLSAGLNDPLVTRPSDDDPHLVVFRVPNVPLDWPLHHALLYHEIGHALIANRQDFLPEPSVPSAYDPKVEVVGSTEWTKKFQWSSKFNNAAQCWFEELYADAVGALLVGPAYFFAFCRFIGSFSSLDTAFSSHPPAVVRISFIRKILDDEGLMASLGESASELAEDWAKVAPDAYRTMKDEHLHREMIEQLVTEAQRAHPLIVELAKGDVGQRRMTAHRMSKNRWYGSLLRDYGIPPIEHDDHQPLTPADVFGAVWAAFLEDGSAPENPKRCEYYAKVLLGALDAVEAMRVWAE